MVNIDVLFSKFLEGQRCGGFPKDSGQGYTGGSPARPQRAAFVNALACAARLSTAFGGFSRGRWGGFSLPRASNFSHKRRMLYQAVETEAGGCFFGPCPVMWFVCPLLFRTTDNHCMRGPRSHSPQNIATGS